MRANQLGGNPHLESKASLHKMIEKQVREYAGAPYEYSKYQKELAILEERKKERIQKQTMQNMSKVMNPIDHIRHNAWNVQQVRSLVLCDHNNKMQNFVKERRQLIKSIEEKQQMLNFYKWDIL